MSSFVNAKEEFELSATLVKGLKQKPTDDELLSLYGLYKQSTEGDNKTTQPSMFYLKDNAKWKAWTANKGQQKEAAMKKYSELVMKLVDKYGVKA
jgi:diazepam-binding inhibitor (GABA receptor modulating acyl-CoA-binding protein)